MKLDLGCGKTPIEGYVGVDLPEDELAIPRETGPLQSHVDADGVIRFDLASGVPWPFADESVDGLFSSHVIEHLPAARIRVYEWTSGQFNRHLLTCTGTQDALFWFLDEAWRITRPGGEFLLRWPALRDERNGEIQEQAFLDPTHYRFIPVHQHLYWCRKGRETLGVSQYRVRCNWALKSSSQRELGGGALRVIENEFLLVKEP